MTTHAQEEIVMQAFAERLRAFFGGELPEGVNVGWDFAGRPVVTFPLRDAEKLLTEVLGPDPWVCGTCGDRGKTGGTLVSGAPYAEHVRRDGSVCPGPFVPFGS